MLENFRRFQKWLWPALGLSLIGIFVVLSSEVHEAAAGEPELIGTIDNVVMRLAFTLRDPRVTAMAVDITALGSTVVMTLLTVMFIIFLSLLKKHTLALHMISAALGAGLLTSISKSFFERDRPAEFSKLIEVQGYSYPSGHSLASAAIYLTMAILACQLYRAFQQRVIVLSIFSILILLIGLSRIYLGVHYPSDVIAGILLGSAWAILLGGLFHAR